MLEKLQNIAIILRPFRTGFLILAALSVAYGLNVLLTSDSQAEDIALIPSFVLFAWATMAHSFTNLFAQLPVPPREEMKIVMRVKARVLRLLYYGFLTMFALASGFLLITSWQLFSAWRMMY